MSFATSISYQVSAQDYIAAEIYNLLLLKYPMYIISATVRCRARSCITLLCFPMIMHDIEHQIYSRLQHGCDNRGCGGAWYPPNVYETVRKLVMQQELKIALGIWTKFQLAVHSFNNLFHCKLLYEHFPYISYCWVSLLCKNSWSKI